MAKRRTKLKKKRVRRRYTRKSQRGGDPPSVISEQKDGYTVYSLYNQYHYGDHLLNLKFFYNISDVLKNKKIKIRYYYNRNYIKKPEELKRYVNPETVDLIPMDRPPPNATEITMDGIHEGPNHRTGIHNIPVDINILDFDIFYPEFYKRILKIISLPDANIDVSLFQNEPYLITAYDKLDPKYKNVDILIINAEPQSGQFTYDKKKMDDTCKRLNTKYNIVTTTPVDDTIKCTMKDGLMLQDIGAISTHAKYIISVHSGPIVPCYNLLAKNNVKRWIILVNQEYKMKEVDTVILKSIDDLANVEKYLT